MELQHLLLLLAGKFTKIISVFFKKGVILLECFHTKVHFNFLRAVVTLTHSQNLLISTL